MEKEDFSIAVILTWLSGIHCGSGKRNGLFELSSRATIFSPLLDLTNFLSVAILLQPKNEANFRDVDWHSSFVVFGAPGTGGIFAVDGGYCGNSLATRLCYDFTLLQIEACTYTRWGLVTYCWPFSSHNCHTREITVNSISNWTPSIPQGHLSTMEDI